MPPKPPVSALHNVMCSVQCVSEWVGVCRSTVELTPAQGLLSGQQDTQTLLQGQADSSYITMIKTPCYSTSLHVTPLHSMLLQAHSLVHREVISQLINRILTNASSYVSHYICKAIITYFHTHMY